LDESIVHNSKFQAYEKFVKEAKTVAAELDRTFIQITDRLVQDDKITPQALLSQRSLQESVIFIPERTIQHGRQLYRDWEDDAVSAGIQASQIEGVDFTEPHFTLDQVVVMNHIKKIVEGLEGQMERIQDLWRDRNVLLGDKLQLSEMEQAMKTVRVKLLLAEHIVMLFFLGGGMDSGSCGEAPVFPI
jgi:hypothetical protein